MLQTSKHLHIFMLWRHILLIIFGLSVSSRVNIWTVITSQLVQVCFSMRRSHLDQLYTLPLHCQILNQGWRANKWKQIGHWPGANSILHTLETSPWERNRLRKWLLFIGINITAYARILPIFDIICHKYNTKFWNWKSSMLLFNICSRQTLLAPRSVVTIYFSARAMRNWRIFHTLGEDWKSITGCINGWNECSVKESLLVYNESSLTSREPFNIWCSLVMLCSMLINVFTTQLGTWSLQSYKLEPITNSIRGWPMFSVESLYIAIA